MATKEEEYSQVNVSVGTDIVDLLPSALVREIRKLRKENELLRQKIRFAAKGLGVLDAMNKELELYEKEPVRDEK